jgi:hypothetical protein
VKLVVSALRESKEEGMSSANSGSRSVQEVVKGKFFAFLGATSLAHGLDRDHVHLGHSYGRNCLLLGWSHQPYEEAIKAVYEARPEVSEKTIAKLLSESMVKLFHQHNVREDADLEADAQLLESILPTLNSSAVNQEVANFLDLLKSHIQVWSAFVFIEGIKLKGLSELSLGVAKLYSKNHGPLLHALEDVTNIEGLNEIPQHIEKFANHCHCYLIIDLEGESEYVNQRALRQAQDVVNVLNLYNASSRHRASFYQRISVMGQPVTPRHHLVFKRTPPIGEDSNSPRYSYFVQRPPMRCYEIDLKKVQRWNEYGLDKVLESISLSGTKSGSVQSRIRSAITWYGRAMNAHTQDEQFVGLTTALESLLVADEKVAITQRLADEVAALLGSDFQSRERIKKRAKELYDLRGRIVHAGMPVSQENLFALDRMVASTLLAFVRKEMLSS